MAPREIFISNGHTVALYRFSRPAARSRTRIPASCARLVRAISFVCI